MATLVLLNGKIITVDDQFSVHQAVAVDGDRITAVGPDAAVAAHAAPGATVLDLGGKTVIPGLIDNHNHFVRATEHIEVRLEGIRARASALGELRRRAAELPPGQWLLTLGGWHEDQWEGDRTGFTLAELDAAAGARPAFIQVQYDHAYANTAWLDTMGVPREAQARETGRVGGGMVALNKAAARFPAGDDPKAGVLAAMGYYNSLGLTAVFDPGGVGVSAAAYATVEAMATRGEMTLRVFTTLFDGETAPGAAGARALAHLITARGGFHGGQWYDQIAVGEIYHAPFHWDHVASPPHPSAADIATAIAILRAAADSGWPVQTHSVTTQGLDLVFDAYEHVNRERAIRPLRWSVTHAEGLTGAHLERARRLGVTIQLRSQSVVGNQRQAIATYGAAAARRMPPLRTVQDSGLTWGLGTDGTRAAQINPFITLWWAVTGASLGGDIVLDEPITREQALIAHTRGNARLMFCENYLGSIAPGLLADMVVLDRDYLTVPDDEIRDIRPAATIVAGKIVYGAVQQPRDPRSTVTV
jgi:predicted amidohydrolase YtcJ